MAVLTESETSERQPALQGRHGLTLWGTAREAFWVALETMRGHKLRTFLTLLGVVIATPPRGQKRVEALRPLKLMKDKSASV